MKLTRTLTRDLALKLMPYYEPHCKLHQAYCIGLFAAGLTDTGDGHQHVQEAYGMENGLLSQLHALKGLICFWPWHGSLLTVRTC